MRDFLWEISKIFRLRFFYLVTRGHIKRLTAIYVLITSFLSLMILGGIAFFLSWPLIFPSLGPTAFLIFYAPARAMSWPRNCLLGHLTGMLCGFLIYFIFYCFSPEEAVQSEFGLTKTLFVSGAVGITALAMVLADILHPPAASTAMLSAGGYFKDPIEVLGFVLALVFIVMEGIVIHRLSGIIYPLWKGEKSEEQPFIRTKIGEVGEAPPSDDPYTNLAHRLVNRRE
ncbi:HPP family protein [Thermosulfurimonas dismutans]|uniref:Putative transmembrane protein n=1 Tax=Thermosulfurimonas dismutans TaxID=999894 RepID=A0A179D7A7_9BACT|nr:HPP family protein [Thermosulfurimonas dismutans]OAQ21488.1 putative transmembrane protein [Thermosulfurimonas dismutans]